MLQTRRRLPRLRFAAGVILAAAVLGACDAPTAPDGRAAAGGPSLLISPGCGGTGGQTHPVQYITTSQTWTRANSPHRVTGDIHVDAGGRLTIAPGALVCFEPYTELSADNGGRLYIRGRDTAQIVLTARDPAQGWDGISLTGAPAGASYVTNARLEHVNINNGAIESRDRHVAWVDSVVIRRSGWGATLNAPGSRLVRSRVDSTTNRNMSAVDLRDSVRFEATLVRGAAGIGVSAYGMDVLLLGGRIEGSGGPGLIAYYHPLNRYSRGPRVTGGRTYGALLDVASLLRLYSTPALQDSLLGNARDTIVVDGGRLRGGHITVGPRLPLRIDRDFDVDSAGTVSAQPGAVLVFAPYTRMVAYSGGRVSARGSAAKPVLFTADWPDLGWGGVTLTADATVTSYLTNVRMEHVNVTSTAVSAYNSHRVIVDSSVIRQSGRAVIMHSPNSRLSRTRVDTTLNSDYSAVELGGNARIESTRIRASAGPGILVWGGTVQIVSCDIRDGDKDGIVMQFAPVPVHNCNLENNLGVGIRNYAGTSVNATGNWWGSVDGPTGAGGDGVSGLVTVSPWRTTPYVLPYLP